MLIQRHIYFGVYPVILMEARELFGLANLTKKSCSREQRIQFLIFFCSQDVSHNTRLMLEDLTTLSTLLDSILGSEKLIPLNVNVKYTEESTS